MRKIQYILIWGIIVLILICGCVRESNYAEPEQQPTETPTLSEEENAQIANLELDFKNAETNSDYVKMNTVKKEMENIKKTALGNFYEEEYFDYTHGGILYSAEYSYKDEDENVIIGNVYILNLPKSYKNTELFSVADAQSIGEKDYVVIDQRYLSDPNMQVRNSYRADALEERECVINILLEYEQKYASDWNRTKETMEGEWYAHNVSYLIGYSVERAMHVDFNNKDEEAYTSVDLFN